MSSEGNKLIVLPISLLHRFLVNKLFRRTLVLCYSHVLTESGHHGDAALSSHPQSTKLAC